MPAHESTLVFEYDSPHRAATVERSVEREVGEIDGGRSSARVTRDGAVVTVRIDARDLVALRAGQNTWTTLVGVAEAAMATGERYR